MKKLILSFAIVAFTAVGVNAQVSFGIKGGLNISSLRTDPDDDAKSLIGGNGGLFATIPVSGMFSIQPEVLYSLEGASYDEAGDPKLLLNYINIPLMLKYNDPSGFYGELGPQVGILTSAKYKEDGANDEDWKNLFKSTNFSLGLGAGWNFSPQVGVGVRYNLGLSNIWDSDLIDGDIKTGNFSIGIHYSFGARAAE